MNEETPSRLTVIHSRYLIPIRPARKILESHSVVIGSGRIVAVLPTTEARERYRESVEINLPDHALMPGLVNMHTHSPMTLLRGYAEDLPMQQWLNERVWPAERRFVCEEFVADGIRLAMTEMSRAGTTCFNEAYFHPDIMAAAVTQAGMRACIGLPVIEWSSTWAGNANEYLEKGLDVFHQWAGGSHLTFSLAPHAPYSVSDVSLDHIAS
ncbi:MAG: amidohydrolase family protein, partial [Lysobacterales bacterium]